MSCFPESFELGTTESIRHISPMTEAMRLELGAKRAHIFRWVEELVERIRQNAERSRDERRMKELMRLESWFL